MPVIFQEDFTGFTGAGFAPTPGAGQLDSDFWTVTGMSDNANPGFGFTSATGDFARGIIGTNNPTTGGVYSLSSAASPTFGAALVLQPGGSDVDPGSITLRIQNTTGAALSDIHVSFDWLTRNNEGRAANLSFSYSTDGMNFTPLTAASTSTPTTAGSPIPTTFTVTPEHDLVLNGVDMGSDSFIYLRWSHVSTAGVSGASRDEVGIDNVSVSGTTVAVDTTPPALSSTSPSEGQLVGANSNLVLSFNETVKAGSGHLTLTDGAGDTRVIDVTDTSQVTISGTTVTINPAADLHITDNYHLSVDAGAITDVAGNAFAAPSGPVLDFSTYNPNPKIYEIQGAGHTSPLVGLQVTTTGVVTAIDTTGSKGFWIQDPTGDDNDATSDAVFVFTNSAVNVHVGDLVSVAGKVTEFQGSDPNNLTITEVDSNNANINVIGTGAITPTLLGDGGRHIPTEVIEDDHFAAFDPSQDAADFYESLEGMVVSLHNVQAVDSTFTGESFVVADGGDAATGMNSRGGITIAPGDMNPERIELFTDSGITPITLNTVAGDHLGDVTGIVSYFGGNYEVVPLSVGATGTADTGGQAPRETTTLIGDASHLTIGEYNLENIDPTDPDSKFSALASDIAHNLGAPDIIGLEEIQDADGAGSGTDFSGTATLTKLVNAIDAAGGPHYSFIEIAPTANNQNGGEPNGNIRQAFLYDASKVAYVDGSAHQILDDDPTNGDAYNNSRRPLVADFKFHGETVTVVDVHNFSRGGSDELFGQDQPPVNAGEQRRIDQTAPVERYVQQAEQADPHAHIVVTGDFNGFQFETAQTQLETGGILTNLTNLLDPTDRYSFIFEGNMEQIDHMYASPSLLGGAEFDIVHLNTGQSASRPTDHDPTLGRFFINTAPVSGADTVAGTEDTVLSVDAAHGVLANDTDLNGDLLTATLAQGPEHGKLALNADGSFTYTPDANFNGPDSFTYVATDPSGAVSGASTVTLNIASVNDAPVAHDDTASVSEKQSVTIDVLVNDTDVDAGDSKTLVSVSATALGGHVSIVDGQVVYVADDDSFDLLTQGQHVTDSFTYVMQDAAGATSTASVTVTVNGTPDAPTQNGGNGDSTLTGTAGDEALNGGNGADRLAGGGGADTLSGGNGDDTLQGGAGIDSLNGGKGDDVLEGGVGADNLTGGQGNDSFVFGTGFGHDTVSDFQSGQDHLSFQGVGFASFADVMAHAVQSGTSVVITDLAGDSVQLTNVSLSSLHAGDFIFT